MGRRRQKRYGDCPVCDRKHQRLHLHHDHTAIEPPKRFPPTLICEDCNRLEGELSKRWIPPGCDVRLSFAPSELRCFVFRDGDGVAVDDDAFHALMLLLGELGVRAVLTPEAFDYLAPLVLRISLKTKMRIAMDDYQRSKTVLKHFGEFLAFAWAQTYEVLPDDRASRTAWRRILGAELEPPWGWSRARAA